MTAAMTYPEIVVEWRIPAILREHNVSAYKFAEVLTGKVNRNSAYDLAAGRSKRVDRETLSALIVALRGITGNRELSVGDLFEYVED